jgi:hypothetical protein
MNFKLQNLTKRLSNIEYSSYDKFQIEGLCKISKYLPLKNFSKNLKLIINHIKKDLIKQPHKLVSESKKEFTVCKVFNNILNNKKMYLIKQNKQTTDPYTRVFMSALDTQVRFMDNYEFNKYTKLIKYTFITEFNKQGYYSRNNYSPKQFKKSDLDDVFANNKPLSLNMLLVLANVLSVNLVYIDKSNRTQYFTNFIDEWATVVMFETAEEVFTIHSKVNKYIRGIEIKKYINIPYKYLSDKSLPELHNICRMKNIDFKKEGKTKKVNKLKSELIQDLSI